MFELSKSLGGQHNLDEEFVAFPNVVFDRQCGREIIDKLPEVFQVNLMPQPFTSALKLLGFSLTETHDVTDPGQTIDESQHTGEQTPYQSYNTLESGPYLPDSSQKSVTIQNPTQPASSSKFTGQPKAEISLETIESQLSKLLNGLSTNSYLSQKQNAPTKPAERTKKPIIKVVDRDHQSSKPDFKTDLKPIPETRGAGLASKVEAEGYKPSLYPSRKSKTPSKPKQQEAPEPAKTTNSAVKRREERRSHNAIRVPPQSQPFSHGATQQPEKQPVPEAIRGKGTPARESNNDSHILRLDVTVDATLNMNIQTRDTRRGTHHPTTITSTKISSDSAMHQQSQGLTGFDRLLAASSSPKLSIQLNYNSVSQSNVKPRREDSSHVASAQKMNSDSKPTITSVRRLKQLADERPSYSSAKATQQSAQKTYEPLFD